MNLKDRLSTKQILVFNLVLLGTIFGFSLAFLSFSCSTPSALKTARAEAAPVPVPTDALAVAESIQTAVRSVADALLPSVVEISVVEVSKQQVPRFDGVPWDFFFGTPDQGQGGQEKEYRSQGLGSGIIVRKDGKVYYVVTNNHVVGEAEEITITLNDGQEFPAKLVGKDARKDLALVSFESAETFPLAVLGDSDQVRVGDWAIAVGNPLGLMSSVTMGIVSAVGRTGGPAGNINDFIQTDAAINQGNSGGALVNIRGEVVGINTWIASPSGGSVGLGFAIPIDNAKKALNDFIAKGKISYGWLGVSLIDVDNGIAQDLQVDGKHGALVSQVFLGSPAEKGGVMPGDFITQLNGRDMKNRDQLVLAVGDLLAGEKADFTIIRGTKKQQVTVRIEERKDDVAAENGKLWPGAVVIPLNAETRKALSLDDKAVGLYVVEAIDKSAAAIMGLQRGDRIIALNGKPVASLSGFYTALNETGGSELWFQIQRGEATLETMRYKR